MKRMIIVFFWVVSLNVQAGEWSGKTDVIELYPYASGSVFIKFSKMINPEDCSRVSWIRLDALENSMGKEIYSTLLTALTTGAKVNYYLSGCFGQYPKVHHIRMTND